MKNILLILALFLGAITSSFAAEVSFEIAAGDSTIKPIAKADMMVKFKTLFTVDPTAPKSGSVNDYINWVNTSLRNTEKHWMSTLVKNFSHKGARCIEHPEAYQFKAAAVDPTFGQVFTVTCLAGPSSQKLVTRRLEFKVQQKKIGNCVSPKEIEDYFKVDANRNAEKATAFAYGTINSRCSHRVDLAQPVPTGIVSGDAPIKIELINSLLDSRNYEGIRGILENSKLGKDPSDNPGNPGSKYLKDDAPAKDASED